MKTFPVKNQDPKLLLIEKLRYQLQKAHAWIVEKEGKLPDELVIDDEKLESFLQQQLGS